MNLVFVFQNHFYYYGTFIKIFADGVLISEIKMWKSQSSRQDVKAGKYIVSNSGRQSEIAVELSGDQYVTKANGVNLSMLLCQILPGIKINFIFETTG